jgi:hypothetical protein
MVVVALLVGACRVARRAVKGEPVLEPQITTAYWFVESCAATSVKPAMTYHNPYGSPSPGRSVNYIRPGRERTWSSRGFLLGILAILLVIAALAYAVTSQVSGIATAPTIGSALSTMEHGHPRTP